MKKLLLAVCLMFGGATLVSAQNEPATTPAPGQTQTTQDQDQDRQQISVSELPDAVTAKLEGQDYSGWTVGNAYKKMDDANQEMFIVELRQGTETKKVKFDKEGNEIEKGKDGEKADNNYRDPSDATQPEQSTETEQSAPETESTTDESATEQSTQPDQATDHAEKSSTETEQQ